jgi:hypothetical protein
MNQHQHEWITSRTGIKERRIVTNESTCDLALIAANNALKMSGINATELDLIILATTTPDKIFPATATILAAMSAKSQVDSLVTMRLSLIPVREVIHSSEVSSVLDKSSLVTIFGGKYEPVPIILANLFIVFFALIARPVLKDFKAGLDPGQYNGASLLGLRGIVIKSHGGADVDSFFQAIKALCLYFNLCMSKCNVGEYIMFTYIHNLSYCIINVCVLGGRVLIQIEAIPMCINCAFSLSGLFLCGWHAIQGLDTKNEKKLSRSLN